MFDLDHLGLMARSLDAVAHDYERLGFYLTPVSQHWGGAPGEKPVRWGTGNRCAMLRRGYLELIAVIDPTLEQNRLPRFLQRFEGLHILAFGCPDADRALAKLRASGFDLPGVSPLERPLPPPLDGHTARFRLLRFDPDAMPEGRVIAIQHETPEVMRPAAWLEHPNGALALESVVVAVADLEEATRRYTRFLGEPSRGRGLSTFTLRGGELVLTSAAALEERTPRVAIPSLPYPAELSVSVADLERTRRSLHERGVTPIEDAGTLLVPARLAGGVWCRFVASEEIAPC